MVSSFPNSLRAPYQSWMTVFSLLKSSQYRTIFHQWLVLFGNGPIGFMCPSYWFPVPSPSFQTIESPASVFCFFSHDNQGLIFPIFFPFALFFFYGRSLCDYPTLSGFSKSLALPWIFLHSASFPGPPVPSSSIKLYATLPPTSFCLVSLLPIQDPHISEIGVGPEQFEQWKPLQSFFSFFRMSSKSPFLAGKGREECPFLWSRT